MDEHVNPTIATVLHRCWPMPIRRDTQPTEEQRLAADLYNMQHKERLRQERAMALQIRHRCNTRLGGLDDKQWRDAAFRYLGLQA